MKILVPVKFCVDYNIRVHVASDGSGVETSNLKHSINPFDEIALEEALRLKEAGKAEEVVALTIGPAKSQDVLRHALALGADKVVHITCDQPLEPLAASKVLGEYFKQSGAKLVLMGKQAIDDDYNQTGQMLAAYLDLPQVTFVSELTVEGEQVSVLREVDAGLVKALLQLPTIVTVDLRLNEPRYATLPNIMKAKSKPIEQVDIASFGVDLAPRLSLSGYVEPELKREAQKLESVDALVELLKEKVAS